MRRPGIVTIRGTSGSGKTYVAQRVMEELGSHGETIPIGPKDRLGGYVWPNLDFAIVGRYETACGGCDGLSWKGAADDIEAAAAEQLRLGRRVLLEGLMVSTWGADRLLRLDEAARALGGLLVVHLTTPLDVCLSSVRERRQRRARAAGKEAPPLNVTNTTSKHAGLITHTRNQRRRGVRIEELDRDAALARVLGALALGEQAPAG